MRVEVANRVLDERDATRLLSDVIANVPPLAKHGGERAKGQGSVTTLGRGKDYLAQRIARDAPDIAARIDEYPSIRAAARAAGIVRERSALLNFVNS